MNRITLVAALLLATCSAPAETVLPTVINSQFIPVLQNAGIAPRLAQPFVWVMILQPSPGVGGYRVNLTYTTLADGSQHTVSQDVALSSPGGASAVFTGVDAQGGVTVEVIPYMLVPTAKLSFP